MLYKLFFYPYGLIKITIAVSGNYEMFCNANILHTIIYWRPQTTTAEKQSHKNVLWLLREFQLHFHTPSINISISSASIQNHLTVKYKQGIIHIFILIIQILNKTVTGSTDREVTFFFFY